MVLVRGDISHLVPAPFIYSKARVGCKEHAMYSDEERQTGMVPDIRFTSILHMR